MVISVPISDQLDRKHSEIKRKRKKKIQRARMSVFTRSARSLIKTGLTRRTGHGHGLSKLVQIKAYCTQNWQPQPRMVLVGHPNPNSRAE
jgi:hypothetical protein